MKLVLDASMALSWFFKDERTPAAGATLRAVKEHGAVVPALWCAEVVHVLVKGEKRGRLSIEQTVTVLDYLRALPIAVECSSKSPSFGMLTLVRRFDLSAYDATYLDLAITFGLLLATCDERLGAAAGELGLRWPARKARAR